MARVTSPTLSRAVLVTFSSCVTTPVGGKTSTIKYSKLGRGARAYLWDVKIYCGDNKFIVL